jgi:DNA-binding response OmpR family regulator
MVGAIRQAHPQVKTVAVAQTFSSGALKAADLLGAQAVLTKPVEAQLLLQRVHSLLRRRPARY